MKKRYVAALSLAVAAGSFYGLNPPGSDRSARAEEARVSFKGDVQPIFKAHCLACHTPGGQGTLASGLDLSTYQGVMTGTKYGPMIIPGNAEYSNLMWLLDWKASAQLRMPHGQQQLPVAERDKIRAWIRQGAKDN